jgi:hypothetical protein
VIVPKAGVAEACCGANVRAVTQLAALFIRPAQSHARDRPSPGFVAIQLFAASDSYTVVKAVKRHNSTLGKMSIQRPPAGRFTQKAVTLSYR